MLSCCLEPAAWDCGAEGRDGREEMVLGWKRDRGTTPRTLPASPSAGTPLWGAGHVLGDAGESPLPSHPCPNRWSCCWSRKSCGVLAGWRCGSEAAPLTQPPEVGGLRQDPGVRGNPSLPAPPQPVMRRLTFGPGPAPASDRP
ncbi:hypothetical LOC541469 protein [Homo sapiens]|uniref:Hypothetical LOC541469 protein n=1 Tax=Homo sapiens TaxID=9606 RepID=Q9H5F7_HUMAN